MDEGLENILTVVGEHVIDAVTAEVQKREIEDKDDPGVIVDPNHIFFRDRTLLGIYHKGKALGAFYIKAGTSLNSRQDKVTAERLITGEKTRESFPILKAKELVSGGGGINVSGMIISLNVSHEIEYIGLHPKGSPMPKIPKGVKSRVIKVESKECPYLLNVVIPKVVDQNGKTIVSDRMIIRHPRATDMDFSGKLDIKPGVVLLDSIAYPGLIESVLNGILENNAQGKRTIGVTALTGKMEGDIAERLLRFGFIPVMNEIELCNHANKLFDYYALKPFDETGIDYSSILLGIEAMQGLREKPVQTPIYVTLGDQGSMCVDVSGNIYLAGIMKPDTPTVNTNGAGDAYAAGLVEAIFRDNFSEKRELGIEGIMRFATAMARAKLDRKPNRKYLDELLSGPFHFDMLPEQISDYTNIIKRKGRSLINEKIREEVSSYNVDYYLPKGVETYA